jgi:signal transduction histidine kinase
MESKKYSILYVDDEINNLVVFRSSFYKNYQIFTAQSASEGLKILEENDIQLVITDQRMPEMSGLEFLEILVERFPGTIRMILTAYADVEIVIEAINKCGIYHYILKPWDKRDLKNQIDNSLAKYELEQENRRLIRDLQLANESLEEKVNQRTIDLHQANEELRALNNLKDKLFSIISHDLKVPLVSLNVLLEVMNRLQENINPEQFKTYSLKVQSYIKNVMDLMENLLEWSLSQMNRVHLEIVEFEVDEILSRNFELYKIIAGQKNIRLELECSDHQNLIVKTDRNLLDSVVRNLLGNAVKYTKPGGKVKLTREVYGNFLKLSISDTGIGIAAGKLEKLFEPNQFYNTKGTANERGVGLGLKLCKYFTEKMNGEITVQSTEGEGSEFLVQIPLN